MARRRPGSPGPGMRPGAMAGPCPRRGGGGGGGGASFGFAEACGHLERALQLWESGAAPDVPGAPPVDGLELRMRAAECANLAGDHAGAASLARVAAGSLGGGTTAGDAALVWE